MPRSETVDEESEDHDSTRQITDVDDIQDLHFGELHNSSNTSRLRLRNHSRYKGVHQHRIYNRAGLQKRDIKMQDHGIFWKRIKHQAPLADHQRLLMPKPMITTIA